MSKRYSLIGPMGSGKSALARRIASRLDGTLFDTDAVFTSRYGDISAFFISRGEGEFRKIEAEILCEAASSNATVIATGGGAVKNRAGMCALRRSTDIVRLTAPVEVLKSRIKNSDRPLKGALERTLVERAPLYEKYADYTVDSSVDSFADFVRVTRAPRKNRYDVVLCDADNTLLDFDMASATAIAQASKSLGLRADADTVTKTFLQVTDVIWKKIERGEITRDRLLTERVRIISGILGENISPDAFNGAYIANVKKTRYTLDGATSFLSELGRRGIKRYIITNAFIDIARERLKALDGYIDGRFVSEELGAYKPAKAFFDGVMGGLGNINRERVLVFGDSESSDIAGGVAYGLDTCLFDRSGRKTTAADYAVTDYSQLLDFI